MRKKPVVAWMFLVFSLLVLSAEGFAVPFFFDGGETGTPAGNGWYTLTGGASVTYSTDQVLQGTYGLKTFGGATSDVYRNITSHNKTVDLWLYDGGGSFQYAVYGDGGTTRSLAVARNTGVDASFYIISTPSTVVTNVSLSVGWHKVTFYQHPNGTSVIRLDDQLVFLGLDDGYNVSNGVPRVGFYEIAGEAIYADNVTVWDGDYYDLVTPASPPAAFVGYNEYPKSITPYNNTGGILYAPQDINRSGARTYFFLNVSSSAGPLQNYTFMFDNGTGVFVNGTVALSGQLSFLTVERYVNSTNGSTIRYQWFVSANDSSNQTPEHSYVAYVADTGVTSWEGFSGNPLYLAGMPPNASSQGGEWYALVENDTLYYWTHRVGPDAPNDHHIYFGHTTDPYDLSQNPLVGVNFPGVNEPTFGDVLHMTSGNTTLSGEYHLFPTERDAEVMYHYVSSTKNNTNWTTYCGGPTNVTGWNPTIVYDDAGLYTDVNGRWHMLLEAAGSFSMEYYSSFDGCNWTHQGQAFPGNVGGGGHNWFNIFANGTWVVYRAVREYASHDALYWYKGSGPFNLTFQGLAANTTQDSEWVFVGQSYMTVPEMIIVPNESQQYFDRLVYLYHAADENNTFVSYDVNDRSFFEIHGVTQFVSPFVPASVNYTLTVQMNSTNNNTFVSGFCVEKDGGGANCTANGTIYFFEVNNGTVNLSWTTGGTHVNGSANVTIAGNTTYVVQAVPLLQFAGNISPSGVALISARNVNISWSQATANSSAVVYNVTLYDGSVNVSVVSTGQLSVLYNLTAQDATGLVVYVTAYDGDEQITQQGQAFNVSLPVSVAVSCPALTYPNEDNLPSLASIQVNISTTSELAVVSVLSRLHANVVNQTVNCTFVASSGDQKNYTCFFPMQYYYAAATYTADANATTAIKVGQGSTTCDYGVLLASKRSANAISFPSAAPGVINAVSSPVITVRNTGNAPFNITTKGYDLAGRSTPAITLAATNFAAGVTLPSSVALQHAVQKMVSQNVNGSSNTSVYYWVSMPTNQLVQEYYSATPWDLTVTG